MEKGDELLREMNLVVYGNASWNGFSSFHLHCTLLLSLKKLFLLFTKALQLFASLAAMCRKRNTETFCLIENAGKNYFMIVFRFILDGTDPYNVTCFTRLFVF